MFTADATIDAVQTAKKTFVNTFVTNEAIKESMVKFIDAQADYTKKAAKVGMDTATTVAQESIKVAQESAKFDYNKFYDTVTKAFTVAKK
jgi:hypothetical protein